MKRRVSLYLNGTKADLDDDALVVFNWAVTDLSNPAAVKNSYSHTVTLPGTATNNAIFGSSFRLDRTIAGGFNASQRVPFYIYEDNGEVMASGYARLDRICTAGGCVHSYDVSLFGGLGGFLYELSNASNGDKLTLADLDYGVNLDFAITKANVAAAWARLGGDTSKPAKWDVVNFAPALNGIPDKDFAADKALAVPSEVGLQSSITTDEGTFTTKDGYCLVNLPEKVDEWAAKDLRCYLQRPVVSFRKIVEAIARTSSWTLDTSGIADVPFLDAWLTRPMLPSLGTFKQNTGGVSVTLSGFGTPTSGDTLGTFTLADVPSASVVNLRASFKPAASIPTASEASLDTDTIYNGVEYMQVTFLQLVAYASDNSKVAASPVFSTYKRTDLSPATLAEWCGYTPDSLNTEFSAPVLETAYTKDGTIYERSAAVEMEITAQDPARVELVEKCYLVFINAETSAREGVAPSRWFVGAGNSYQPGEATATDVSAEPTVSASGTIRSGSTITKKMLLSTSASPAEYLVSFCKMAGLYIVADQNTKTARIIKRKAFFVDETIDLTERLDRSRDIEISPLTFDAKWYELKHESVGGSWMDEYKSIEGVQYGVQRIDTGYDFDAETKDLLAGAALKAAGVLLDGGRFWNIILHENTSSAFSALTAIQTKTNTILRDGAYQTVSGYEVKIYNVVGRSEVLASGRQADLVFDFACAKDENGIILQIFRLSKQTQYTDTPLTLPSGTATLEISGYPAIGATACKGHGFVFYPSICSGDSSYTLWDGSGNNLETQITAPLETAVITQYNAAYPGYDSRLKAEFRDGKNAPIDGADVLLMLNGFQSYARFSLTDDVADMDTIAGGPCWLLGANAAGLSVPIFTRFTIDGIGNADKMLDFGMPRQVCAPYNFLAGATSLYSLAWKTYLRDRLDVNCKVLRCRVHLAGLLPGLELLRRFYWYEGSLWALTKISNYSLTTFDPAECEFVQVRDKSNYLTGQY